MFGDNQSGCYVPEMAVSGTFTGYYVPKMAISGTYSGRYIPDMAVSGAFTLASKFIKRVLI